MVTGRSSSIRQAFTDRAAQKGCYRFLNNEKVSEQALITEMTNRCSRFAANRHLLVIQDTTSFNLNNHYRRLKKQSGLGPIEDNFSLGFFLHCSLVMDAFSETVLGFSDVQLWHRRYDDPFRASKIKHLPIEAKESYKWIRASTSTKDKLKDAASITFIEDRDADIYEQFVTVPDAKTHLIIRACKQRMLSNGKKLFVSLHEQTAAGSYTIALAKDRRQKRVQSSAILEVRFKKVCIAHPKEYYKKDIADAVHLYAVEAIEINYQGKDKICWRLLTTHQVTCLEEALYVIECYKKRWHIEQLFRLLKKQGFKMEESELESGWAIRKLLAIALNATLRIMQLMHASEEQNTQPLDEVFSQPEQACLGELNETLTGSTTKHSNPYKYKTLVWAKWIIARLGGWKGYTSQRKPGPITLKRGMDKFTQIFSGWCLALKYYEDVGTQ
ncbi:MAG: IS4 family transposase [Flavisolibacter sp.]|nr:IS4 family transposase [Flavisolibacter sp.]